MHPDIRPARRSDLEAVEKLLAASKLPVEGVAASLDGFIVAETVSGLAGVAGLERCGRDALLRSVAVAEDWRGRGVGNALVTRLISNAQQDGLERLYLLTTTADRWFPAFGFTRITRDEAPDAVRATSEFRDICPSSAVVMVRGVTRTDVTAAGSTSSPASSKKNN